MGYVSVQLGTNMGCGRIRLFDCWGMQGWEVFLDRKLDGVTFDMLLELGDCLLWIIILEIWMRGC